MNKIIITGRTTKEITLEETARGIRAASFTVAVYDGVDDDGERRTVFIPCKAYGNTAETIAKYTSKGDFISIGGKLQIDSWEKDNEIKYFTYIFVQEVDLIPTAKKAEEKEEKPKKKYSRR